MVSFLGQCGDMLYRAVPLECPNVCNFYTWFCNFAELELANTYRYHYYYQCLCILKFKQLQTYPVLLVYMKNAYNE